MTAYVLVEITITDLVLYEEVKQQTPSIVSQYGGRYLARGGSSQLLRGERLPERLVLLEFPTMEMARAWESSVEYTRVKQVRDRCARVNMILLEGI